MTFQYYDQLSRVSMSEVPIHHPVTAYGQEFSAELSYLRCIRNGETMMFTKPKLVTYVMVWLCGYIVSYLI